VEEIGMLDWLYRVLFAPRAKWVLEKYSPDGTRNVIRAIVYCPDGEDWHSMERWSRGLVEEGWQVVYRPKRRETR
jgi:hypothetical protein